MLIVFGVRGRNKRQRTIFNITSKVHFTVLYSFIGLLLVMTIAVESFYTSSEASDLPPKAPESTFHDSVFTDIIDGNKPDQSMLVTERTHEIGDKLTIEQLSIGNDRPDLLIERKEVNDGLIEEHIYKPHFIFNDYDFSNEIGIISPTWQADTITLKDAPAFEFEFVFYENPAILNQFIGGDDIAYFSNHFSSVFSAPVIHLLVPRDLEIIDLYDQAIFVDEWRDEEG